jgi:hypothetical protein
VRRFVARETGETVRLAVLATIRSKKDSEKIRLVSPSRQGEARDDYD